MLTWYMVALSAQLGEVTGSNGAGGVALGELDGEVLGELEGEVLGELEGEVLGELEGEVLGGIEPEGAMLGAGCATQAPVPAVTVIKR
jgi:hypothetical protein